MSPRLRKLAAFALAIIMAGALLGACSSDGTSEASNATDASDSATIDGASKPQPTVALVWQAVREGPVLRFVADIHNPGPEPLVGLTTEWRALDPSGVVVGSRKVKQPTLPAGSTLSYVGGAGAGSLTGTPASVTISVTDPGKYKAKAPSPFLQVDDVQIAQTSAGDATAREITGDLSSTVDVETKSIGTALVVRNPDGSVLLADFDGDVSAPSTLPAGTKARVRFRSFDVVFPEGATATIQAWSGT